MRPEGLAARRRTGGGSSDPLVGDLRLPESTDQGLDDRVPTCNDGPRTSPANRREDRLETRGSSRGWDPSYSVLVWCFLAQEVYLRGGGDEETRTPDLLLAKEMLCQLSYVPLVH